MGTRATYEFRHELHGTQTFYIHWDGYPEGAAMYFREMFEFNQRGASLAAKFFRANPTAQFTDDKDSHGDTEYHYLVENRKVQAFKILRNHETGGCAYNTVFRGDLYEFVEARAPWVRFREMNEIPMTISRSDLSRELRRMLDKRIAIARERLVEYDNDHNDKMADAMDSYLDGLEYAYACIESLDEEYKKAYTITQRQVKLED